MFCNCWLSTRHAVFIANPGSELIVCTALTRNLIHMPYRMNNAPSIGHIKSAYREQNDTSAQNINTVIACRDQHQGFKGRAQMLDKGT